MKLTSFSVASPLLLLVLPLHAQINSLLSVAPPMRTVARRNQPLSVDLQVQLKSGHHVNSNTPADQYLIPLKLTWDTGQVQALEVVYPKPSLEKYSFSEKPVSVFSGDFKLTTRFHVPANAPLGASTVTGKLRYQACTNTMCFPPRSTPVSMPVEIRN